MRPYAACRRAGTVYLVSDESDSCEQCLRYNRFCDLAFPTHEWERLRRAKERLSQQISEKRRIALEADAAIIRLQRQRRLVEDKLRAISNRELRNIQEIEIDELISGVIIEKVDKMLSETPVKPAEILNPFSPRSSSFLNFALLGSPNKIPAKSLSSRWDFFLIPRYYVRSRNLSI
jgi:hypothetical protein